ncbi:hypothetical protein BD779DRAFT_1526131 [Infundibulicybe gibba]|nr:hypothetical protein BD779DRAFT_1526131 [Infundibulicybe gibba]
MARATRSSAHLEKSEQPQQLPQRTSTKQHGNKKRKRLSAADIEGQPAPNSCGQNGTISSATSQIPGAGDRHLGSEVALQILDILEMIDTQGLLDRILPLPSDTLSQPQASSSLRTLLKDSPQQPLWVLRSIIQHLFPISLHPRSPKPAPAATQQLRFCNLALSLFDQASSSLSDNLTLSLASILPPETDDVSIDPHPPPRRKYALVQHLPTGDYWTSLNNTASELKNVPTGHAELVAIVPSLAPSHVAPPLGSYCPAKVLVSTQKKALPAQRRVTTGVFLDYGLWSSFAPAFDHDGEVVGRRELGEVVYGWEKGRRAREAALREPVEGVEEIEDVDMGGGEVEIIEKQMDMEQELDELGELLPPEDVKRLKDALGSWELECAVQELLDRNRKALERLEMLQRLRFTAEGGGISSAEEGSEEWDTAQGIMDSLSTLASLRPRSATADNPTIIPPTSVLRKLFHTLSLEPSPGYYGNLPTSRAAALRDNSTLKVKPGTTPAAASTTATATPTTSTPTPLLPGSAATPYSTYAYAYQQQQQQQQAASQQGYRATQPTTAPYTPYKPGQTYYPTPYTPQQQQQQQSYYGQQQQSYGVSGQQPYAAAYTNWYSTYPAAAAAAGGSGRATPQPATYGSFFGGAGAGAVVANTVAAKPGAAGGAAVGQQQGQWGNGYTMSQGVPMTLPPHLRPTAYQGVYQQPASATPSAK